MMTIIDFDDMNFLTITELNLVKIKYMYSLSPCPAKDSMYFIKKMIDKSCGTTITKMA